MGKEKGLNKILWITLGSLLKPEGRKTFASLRLLESGAKILDAQEKGLCGVFSTSLTLFTHGHSPGENFFCSLSKSEMNYLESVEKNWLP